MGYGIQMYSACFNDMVPDLTPAMPYCALFMAVSRIEFCRTGTLREGRIFVAINITGLNLCVYFLSEFLVAYLVEALCYKPEGRRIQSQ
jgi:hypothetical protein